MVIDSMELICGNSYSLEKAEQVISGGWALDPGHPTKHIYAKTALNLMEKVANKRDSPISPQTSNRKRTWSASNRSEHDGGGGRGGHSGGLQAGSGSGKNNRMTERSRKWPEVRRNDGPRSCSESSHDGGYGGYSGGYGSESRGAGGYRNDNRYVDNRSGGGIYGSMHFGGGGTRSGPESGNDRYYRGGEGRGGGGRGGRGWRAGKVFNPY
jgi:hypothetical protein